MKKSYLVGILSAALVIGGGTGAYITFAKENVGNSMSTMHENLNSEQMNKMMESGDMKQMMESGDMGQMQSCGTEQMMGSEDMQLMMEEHQNMTFGEILPHAKEMHPDLSDEELEEMYNNMHGENGSPENSL